MEVRGREDVVQRPGAQVDVAVLEVAVHHPNRLVRDQLVAAQAEPLGHEPLDERIDRELAGVRPPGVHPVEALRAVVHGVEAPSRPPHVQQLVEPRVHQVEDRSEIAAPTGAGRRRNPEVGSAGSWTLAASPAATAPPATTNVDASHARSVAISARDGRHASS